MDTDDILINELLRSAQGLKKQYGYETILQEELEQAAARIRKLRTELDKLLPREPNAF